MAITVLPLDATLPAYTVDVDLSGTVYRLKCEYNTRAEAWILGLGLPDGTQIVEGQPLRADAMPLRAIVDERLPPGRIFVMDTTSAGTDPAYEDLGVRVLVCYDDGE